MRRLPCFKSYDIRGRVDDTLTEDIAYALGCAVCTVLAAQRVVVGRDIRLSSPRLAAALADGLRAGGADVADLGLCGTEEVYFATDHIGACAGVMVTASHNPADDNGFKIVGRGASPLSPAAFDALHDETGRGPSRPGPRRGRFSGLSCRDAYVDRVLSFVPMDALGPMHVLTDAGHGAAGPTFDALAGALAADGVPLRFTRHKHVPDGRFPAGVPNPLLPENQPETAKAVVAADADLGVAWDADFDRCFFFDAEGAFVSGEYVVGLLAAAMLASRPGSAIVHDARVVWNTRRLVAAHGGRAVMAPTGHALMKAEMRAVDAVYGGELSAHHYFRDFMYCDSGMIPWLLLVWHLTAHGRPLADLVADMRTAHPSSGEINFSVDDIAAAMENVARALPGGETHVAHGDGLILEDRNWRVNVRASSTEPLLRLNVETRGDTDLLAQKVAEVRALLAPHLTS
ncbi:MAG: phosphomannomutase/phosphoglucomutase [Shimia sp.]